MIFPKVRREIIVLCTAVCFLGSAQAAEQSLIPIGHTVGIVMQSDGVLVAKLGTVETTEGTACPAKQAGLQEGDIIRAVNGKKTENSIDMQKWIALSGGQPVTLTVERDGKLQKMQVMPCKERNGTYRIGILTRDGIAGIGTLTYVDPEDYSFGSLGHAISDAGSGKILPLRDGSLIKSVVSTVKRGLPGDPGALQGEFSAGENVGVVSRNTENGIFGTVTDSSLYEGSAAVPVAGNEEITAGAVTILSNVSGDTVHEYQAEIIKTEISQHSDGRDFMLCITDAELLSATGGIVQGMSGSPILQNGKLIGAVTHVLISDPTKGYGITIENMLMAEHAGQQAAFAA